MALLSHIVQRIGVDLAHGDYLIAALGTVFLCMFLGVGAAIVYGVFYVIDVAFVPVNVVGATVTRTWFAEGWTDYAHTPAIQYPAQWLVSASADTVHGTFSVGQGAFPGYAVGNRVRIHYRVGRLSGRVYPTSMTR